MHEKDLVAEALETLRSLVDGEPMAAVEIVLGPGVDGTRAIRAWRVLTEDTPFEGVHVTWERGLDLLRCERCDHEYTGEELDTCPYCGGDGVVVESAVPIEIGHWSAEPVGVARV
jgi:Zn finger protein HypA/HybF involved in hydrogenase expression